MKCYIVPFSEMSLSLMQIDVADVGNEFSVWSIFGESHEMPDLHVTNKDVIVNVNDPRHRSFGRRLLMPSDVHGMFVIVTVCQFYVNFDT